MDFPSEGVLLEAPRLVMLPAISIEDARAARLSLLAFIDEMLVDGTDFGVIPGTERRTLLQPGAEKLAWFYGLYVDLSPWEVIEDWTGADHEGEPLFAYTYRAVAERDGIKVATAFGSDNTWGARYRYRWVRPDEVPQGTLVTITRSTEYAEPDWAIRRRTTAGTYGKPVEYWDRLQKAIDGGTAIKSTRPGKDGKSVNWYAVVDEAVRISNPDVMGQAHTCAMIAQKRAFVAVVRRACALGDLFTQDVEELAEDERAATGTPVGAHGANGAPAPAQTPAPAPAPAPVQPAPVQPAQVNTHDWAGDPMAKFDVTIPVPYWSASGARVGKVAITMAGRAAEVTLHHLIRADDKEALACLAGMVGKDEAQTLFAELAGLALSMTETGEIKEATQ